MVTVHREAASTIVIFVDDHAPAHVDMVGDGNAKVNLAGANGRPDLVYNDGLKAGDVRKAMRIVSEQQAMLLKRWSEIHG